MVFISELQQKTLQIVDSLIEEGKTHEEIQYVLYSKGYDLVKEIKNGYMSKRETKLYKNGDYSFVDLIRRRNGLADWQTIKLS